MLKVLALLALVGGLLVVAGCGSDSESSSSGDESAEESSTPAQAVAEIVTIRALLDKAVTKYASGDQSGAADDVGDIYLEHYEHVEGRKRRHQSGALFRT